MTTQAHAVRGAITVIIPAHNEGGVIRMCLVSLLRQTLARPMRIVVVANGCSDRTAEIARAMAPAAAAAGHELLVEELGQGCKPDALNHGDAVALEGIRVYVDADVRLSADALEGVVEELESGRALLSAPALLVAPALSAATRGYVAVWSRLPVVRQDVMGCGVYAVSAPGRARWGRFPRIISDDKFVRLSFTREERRVAPRGSFTIQMPEGLLELVRVRGRWCRGNRELVQRIPEVGRRESQRYGRTLLFLARNPGLWGHVPLFVMVFVLGHFAALWRQGQSLSLWERAEGARVAIGSAAEVM